jgi:hypothetical protein
VRHVGVSATHEQCRRPRPGQRGGHDVRPRGARSGRDPVPGGLIEPDEVVGEERAAGIDLGQDARDGGWLVGEPRGIGADHDPLRRQPIGARQGDTQQLERQRPT